MKAFTHKLSEYYKSIIFVCLHPVTSTKNSLIWIKNNPTAAIGLFLFIIGLIAIALCVAWLIIIFQNNLAAQINYQALLDSWKSGGSVGPKPYAPKANTYDYAVVTLLAAVITSIIGITIFIWKRKVTNENLKKSRKWGESFGAKYVEDGESKRLVYGDGYSIQFNSKTKGVRELGHKGELKKVEYKNWFDRLITNIAILMWSNWLLYSLIGIYLIVTVIQMILFGVGLMGVGYGAAYTINGTPFEVASGWWVIVTQGIIGINSTIGIILAVRLNKGFLWLSLIDMVLGLVNYFFIGQYINIMKTFVIIPLTFFTIYYWSKYKTKEKRPTSWMKWWIYIPVIIVGGLAIWGLGVLANTLNSIIAANPNSNWMKDSEPWMDSSTAVIEIEATVLRIFGFMDAYIVYTVKDVLWVVYNLQMHTYTYIIGNIEYIITNIIIILVWWQASKMTKAEYFNRYSKRYRRKFSVVSNVSD